MKYLILAIVLTVSTTTIASIACDTKNRLGFQGKMFIDLSEKIIIFSEEGKDIVIFDQHTFCGSSVIVDCPFITQENESNLISDLRCYLRTETSPVLVVSGNLSLHKKLRSGIFKCSVYGSRGIDLKLNNCNL